jgi:alpha-L-rhamnosidase
MKWMWTSDPLAARNRTVRFRTQFSATGGEARLRITADSRYHLYVNGTPVGFGPVRSWPNHWKFDDYDLSPYLRKGENVIAVLVRHFGTGNFQYIAADPGLAAELRGARGRAIPLEWKASPSPAFAEKAPRISAQLAFEEQFDARLEDDWKEPGYRDSGWSAAVFMKSPHGKLEPRGIPFLTREEVLPVRVVACERVVPITRTWTLSLRRYHLGEEQAINSNFSFVKGYAISFVRAGRAEGVVFLRPHRHAHAIKVNGKTIPALDPGFAAPVGEQIVPLKKGWNTVLIPITNFPPGGPPEDVGGSTHLSEFVLAVRAKQAIVWASSPGTGGDGGQEAPWRFVGPFAFTEEEREAMGRHMDFPRIAQPENIHPQATAEAFVSIWKRGSVDDAAMAAYARPVAPEDTITANVFAEAVGDVAVGLGRLEGAEALVAGGGDVAVLHPAAKGEDVRVLFDFGKEVVGMHAFEVEAEAGTVIDFHNFEFIQPDGRHNLAEGMNNTLRYICRDGWQRFESIERRGFRYSWMIARNFRKPIRIRKLATIFSTYPQQNRGSFACSDEKLNRIWRVGAHTLRCCAEDTYTDCPTYEQTHWVGDARNEALVDWVVNGDPRLWFRCLEQTGQSLERFPITGSEVPSSWENILPAWSFLWMRSCREYLLWTGDFDGARKLFAFVEKNVAGIRAHLNEEGLFAMQAWNLFDWAAMDTPTQGVVTHNNCFVVLALNECAQLADWLKKKRVAADFRALATSVAEAVNTRLWDPRRKAYIDCIHAGGRRSDVFSQQTQTVALSSGVAKGARAKRCREIVHNPPEGFVKAGSPFFEFFLLEALAEEGRENEFLDTIRRDWGFMIEQGATTFWEMWSIKGGRLTRSHCHGWSSAPTFFLSSTVLGIEPLAPGCREIRFDPRIGELDFVRGEVPTPFGNIRVDCRREGNRVIANIETPKEVKVERAEG